jgi:hypothetical protein
MKKMLKIMLLATCLASLATSSRAQLKDDAGTVTTDQSRAGGATHQGSEQVKEPAGEPKGTNVTGAETTTDETTVDPSDAKKQDSQSSAAEEKSPEGPRKNRLSAPDRDLIAALEF